MPSWSGARRTAGAADQFHHDQMHGGWVENVIPRELGGLLESGWVR